MTNNRIKALIRDLRIVADAPDGPARNAVLLAGSQHGFYPEGMCLFLERRGFYMFQFTADVLRKKRPAYADHVGHWGPIRRGTAALLVALLESGDLKPLRQQPDMLHPSSEEPA